MEKIGIIHVGKPWLMKRMGTSEKDNIFRNEIFRKHKI